jgi:Uma2 family endonuclease
VCGFGGHNASLLIGRYQPNGRWTVKGRTMAHVAVSPELSAFISARIDMFASETPEQLRWVSRYVAEFAALPLYLGWAETIGIRADGEVIRWSTEGDYSGTRPVEEPEWVLSALVCGAGRHPELRVLLPERGPGSIDCVCRNDELFVSGKVLCGECGGLGWLPLPMPGTDGDPSDLIEWSGQARGGCDMVHTTQTAATLDDLYRVEGKAELIGGRIVRFMPSGDAPSETAFEIAVRLRDYARQRGLGVAHPDGIGYAIDPPLPNGRQSFSPDASYYDGPRPKNRMRFIPGAPTFAVEVRSENDYGPAAEAEMAAKRADYFAAGTLVVWDVDPLAGTIASYRADAPTQPSLFARGLVADAEPAVPGWRLPVDDIFP